VLGARLSKQIAFEELYRDQHETRLIVQHETRSFPRQGVREGVHANYEQRRRLLSLFKSLMDRAVESIHRMPDRQVDYLTLIALPFVIYGCCTRGTSHQGLEVTILLLAFVGVGLLRAVRFPGLVDAIYSPFLGWSVGFAAGSLVQLLHPTVGGPASWLKLGFIGSFAFSGPAFALLTIQITDGPAFDAAALRRRLDRQLVRLRGLNRRKQPRR
jgi:hypothetical protein